MEKHIDRHLSKDIKQIMSMQSLLEEYDRENKYLNEQVIHLLTQNSKLKMDRARNNIINSMFKSCINNKKNEIKPKQEETPKKEEVISMSKKTIQKQQQGQGQGKSQNKEQGSVSKIKRNNSRKIIQRFRNERGDDTVVQINTLKKDEGVQAAIPNPKQNNGKGESLFSFRNIPLPEENIDKIDQHQAKNSLQSTLKMFNESSPKKGEQKIGISRDESNLMTIKREKSIGHAIKPSPQIKETSIKLLAHNSASSKSFRSQQKLNVSSFEVREKKTFLQVTTKHSPVKAVIMRGNDCC